MRRVRPIAKAQGKRGKQMNPNWSPDQRKPGAPDEEKSDAGRFTFPLAGPTDPEKVLLNA
jgi:hypothetical protein